MAESNKLLSIEQSASLAGVSKDTIRQYQALGLVGAIQQDGITLLKSEDIQSVFGIKLSKNINTTVVANLRVNSSHLHMKLASDSTTTESELRKQRSSSDTQLLRLTKVRKLEKSNFSLSARCRALEARLKLVNDERDWLRSRVERLETRSEREQMLLLAQQRQTQLLLGEHSSKRSFWQIALPWLNKNSAK